ncbi:MAG: hypothetical protein ACOCWR_04135 [Oceanidesulfovibrio sp.]
MRKLVWFSVVLMLFMAGGVAGYVFWPQDQATVGEVLDEVGLRRFAQRMLGPGKDAAEPLDEVTRDLGDFQGYMGESMEQKQARDLLDLVYSQPGKDRYTITYMIGRTRHTFIADLRDDALMRLEKTGPHGKNEYWVGYSMERLENAAEGGSLAETPEGRDPARVYEY